VLRIPGSASAAFRGIMFAMNCATHPRQESFNCDFRAVNLLSESKDTIAWRFGMQLPKLTNLRRLPWNERVASAVILVSLACWPSSASAQSVGDAGARPSTIPTQMESHVG